MENKNNNALVYARVGTGKQCGKSESIVGQIRSCSKQAEKDGYIVAEKKSDSGSANNIRRLGLKKLIDSVRKNKIGMVYVRDHSRLSRNLGDYVSLLNLFAKHEVELRMVKKN